jgi:hypothetical protein
VKVSQQMGQFIFLFQESVHLIHSEKRHSIFSFCSLRLNASRNRGTPPKGIEEPLRKESRNPSERNRGTPPKGIEEPLPKGIEEPLRKEPRNPSRKESRNPSERNRGTPPERNRGTQRTYKELHLFTFQPPIIYDNSA